MVVAMVTEYGVGDHLISYTRDADRVELLESL